MYDRYTEVCQQESITPIEFAEFADHVVDYFVDKTRESIKAKDTEHEIIHFGVTRLNDEMNMLVMFDDEGELSLMFNTMPIDELREMLTSDEFGTIVN